MGCDHEDSARSAYADTMKDVHSGFACKESGLIVMVEYAFIGTSPDGNIQCECCNGIGVLEVKYLYCVREGEPHMFYYQVQTQLCVQLIILIL